MIERKKSLYKEGSLDRLLTKLFQPDDSIISLKLVVEYFLIKIQTPYKFFYLPKISNPNPNPNPNPNLRDRSLTLNIVAQPQIWRS